MRRAFLILVVLLPIQARAQDTTNIRVRYETHSYRVSPSPGPALGHMEVAMTLSGKNQVSDSAIYRGRHEQTNKRSLQLGGGSDSNVTYRIIDKNTIQSIRSHPTYTATITVKVSQRTCRATVDLRLKPGHQEIEAYAASFGTNGRFRNTQVRNVTCEIN